MGSASYPGRTAEESELLRLGPAHQPKHHGYEADDGQDSDDDTHGSLLPSRDDVLREVYTHLDGSYAGSGTIRRASVGPPRTGTIGPRMPTLPSLR